MSRDRPVSILLVILAAAVAGWLAATIALQLMSRN